MIKTFIGEIHVDDQELAFAVAGALETSAPNYEIEVYGATNKFDPHTMSRNPEGRVSMKVYKIENAPEGVRNESKNRY